MIMRYQGNAYHRLLLLVLVVVLPIYSGSGHLVVGGLWLESSRVGVKGVGRRVCLPYWEHARAEIGQQLAPDG